jgi:MFS family permease
MTDDRSRTMQAILRTAMIWAAAWAVAGGAIMALLSMLNPAPGVGSLAGRVGLALLAGVSWGVRFGLAGAVIGAVFSSVIRLGYHGRRLADIDPVRFGLLGAVVGGVGVPLYLQAMNLLTGGHLIAWNLVTDDAVWATVFGAAVAAGSIMLARRADALAAGADRQQLGHGPDLSAPLAGGTTPAGQVVDSGPSRSTYR